MNVIDLILDANEEIGGGFRGDHRIKHNVDFSNRPHWLENVRIKHF